MGGLMSSPKPKVTPIAPAPAADPATDAKLEEERKRQQEIEAKSKGRAATVLTGGDGDTEVANVEKKRLLGN